MNIFHENLPPGCSVNDIPGNEPKRKQRTPKQTPKMIEKVALAIYLQMFPERFTGDWIVESADMKHNYRCAAWAAIKAMGK